MTDSTDHPLFTLVDLSPYRRIVDIGGGSGTTLEMIMNACPQMRGILFDLPEVIATVQINMEAMNGRLVPVGGDFFEQVPSGGDLYLLERVLSDWDGDWAQGILQSAHKAMPHGARLLLLDMLLREGGLTDSPDSRGRTEMEYRELLETTGFTIISVTPLEDSTVLIQAEPT